jgi:hypothetical protein
MKLNLNSPEDDTALEDDYAAAWQEWESSGEQAIWDGADDRA